MRWFSPKIYQRYGDDENSTQGIISEEGTAFGGRILCRVNSVEPASELCVIEAWRVFPALTGVERTAFQAVNWGGTAEVIRSLVRDLDGLFFCP